MDDTREQPITMIDIIKTGSLDDNIDMSYFTPQLQSQLIPNAGKSTNKRTDQSSAGDGAMRDDAISEDVAISFEDDDGVSPRGYVRIPIDHHSIPPELLKHEDDAHLLDMGGAQGGFPLDETCIGVDNFSQSNSATDNPSTARSTKRGLLGITRARPATVHHSVSTEPLMRPDSPDLEAYHAWTWSRKHLLLVCIITVQGRKRRKRRRMNQQIQYIVALETSYHHSACMLPLFGLNRLVTHSSQCLLDGQPG